MLASTDSDIILLDDPFSAVDGATGNFIFENGVLKGLKGCIRIIALNSHRHLLRQFDRVIILDNGFIVGDGRPEDLSTKLLYGVLNSTKTEDDNGANDNYDDNNDNGDDDNISHDDSHSDVSIEINDNDIDYIPIMSTNKNSGKYDNNGDRGTNNEYKNDDDDNDNSNEYNINKNNYNTDNIDTNKKNDNHIGKSNKSNDGNEHKSDKHDNDKLNNDILKEKTKLLILKETMRKGDVDINVYLKYFAACYNKPGYSIFNENPDIQYPSDTDKNDEIKNKNLKKNSKKFMFNLKSYLLILGLLSVFSIAQVLNVGINYCLARWAEYGGLPNGSLLNNNYSKAYYIFFGVLFIFLFIRSAYLNIISSYSAQHIYR